MKIKYGLFFERMIFSGWAFDTLELAKSANFKNLKIQEIHILESEDEVIDELEKQEAFMKQQEAERIERQEKDRLFQAKKKINNIRRKARKTDDLFEKEKLTKIVYQTLEQNPQLKEIFSDLY